MTLRLDTKSKIDDQSQDDFQAESLLTDNVERLVFHDYHIITEDIDIDLLFLIDGSNAVDDWDNLALEGKLISI